MKGEAEAFAVEAKGRAEAEQMTKKAEAFQQYKDGAMVDMLLEKLPLVRNTRLHRAQHIGPKRDVTLHVNSKRSKKYVSPHMFVPLRMLYNLI